MNRTLYWHHPGRCSSVLASNTQHKMADFSRNPQVERIIVTHGKPEHPHNSDEFYAHTGLQEYPKYMVGGGYVISDDVAR